MSHISHVKHFLPFFQTHVRASDDEKFGVRDLWKLITQDLDALEITPALHVFLAPRAAAKRIHRVDGINTQTFKTDTKCGARSGVLIN